MEIPKNNEPELAQWYLERGRDQLHNGGFWLLFAIPVGVISIAIGVGSIVSPIFWPHSSPIFDELIGLIFLPLGYWSIKGGFSTRQEGRHKIAIGEAMNEAVGRVDNERSMGMATNHFQRGWSAGLNTRYYPASTHPPVEPVWS